VTDVDTAVELLREGDLQVRGRLVDASNATLFCTISMPDTASRVGDAAEVACVYKPIKGERPLWDFPTGTLAGREVAAYEVSVATGWDIVPPTVMRDGPFGPGMCQLWCDIDEDVDLVELVRSDHPQLRRMAVFDAVVNNADRKGGHILPLPDGRIQGVDHGVCFSVEDKLRTLLWGWSEQPLTVEATAVLSSLRDQLDGDLGQDLTQLISRREVARTRRRVARLLATGRHPSPSGDWPPVPWPPF
jgi:uncharacterized repeat protein (TIGR03843 family)